MAEATIRAPYDPIRQATTVRAGREHTFGVFVRRLGDWWPTRTHSLGLDRVVSVHVEEMLDGRVYEVWDDGRQEDWGRIIAWDPPARFALTWNTLSAETEVEVRFLELGPALTRVELKHRGWERLPAEEAVRMTTPPNVYPDGWHRILGLFTAHAEAAERGA